MKKISFLIIYGLSLFLNTKLYAQDIVKTFQDENGGVFVLDRKKCNDEESKAAAKKLLIDPHQLEYGESCYVSKIYYEQKGVRQILIDSIYGTYPDWAVEKSNLVPLKIKTFMSKGNVTSFLLSRGGFFVYKYIDNKWRLEKMNIADTQDLAFIYCKPEHIDVYNLRVQYYSTANNEPKECYIYSYNSDSFPPNMYIKECSK